MQSDANNRNLLCPDIDMLQNAIRKPSYNDEWSITHYFSLKCMQYDWLPDRSLQKHIRLNSSVCCLYVCFTVWGKGVNVCGNALLNGIIELHHKSVPHQRDKMKSHPPAPVIKHL